MGCIYIRSTTPVRQSRRAGRQARGQQSKKLLCNFFREYGDRGHNLSVGMPDHDGEWTWRLRDMQQQVFKSDYFAKFLTAVRDAGDLIVTHGRPIVYIVEAWGNNQDYQGNSAWGCGVGAIVLSQAHLATAIRRAGNGKGKHPEYCEGCGKTYPARYYMREGRRYLDNDGSCICKRCLTKACELIAANDAEQSKETPCHEERRL